MGCNCGKGTPPKAYFIYNAKGEYVRTVTGEVQARIEVTKLGSGASYRQAP